MNQQDIATAAAGTVGFLAGTVVAGPAAGAAVAAAAAAGARQLSGDNSKPAPQAPESTNANT